MDIYQLSKSQEEYITRTRRYLHQYPEVGFQEKQTSLFIQRELSSMNIPFEIVGEYGVVATIEGQHKNKMVALRADIDALPIEEQNTHLEYVSKTEGTMHACGHDAHTAMLLGAAKVLSSIKDTIQGTVKLCFQQAEEVGGAAEPIVQHLKQFPVLSCFGIHVCPELKTGTFAANEGMIMASFDYFEITVMGEGCHGSRPDMGIDPILASAQIVTELSSLMSRTLNPMDSVTVSVGSIHSGIAANTIPDKAILTGTIRTFNEQTRQQTLEMVERIVKGIDVIHKTKTTVFYDDYTPALLNDPSITRLIDNCITKLFGEGKNIYLPPSLGSEDFSFFTNTFPGAMLLLGTGNLKKDTEYDYHHPKFNIDEDALVYGTALHCQYAIDTLSSH